MASEREILMLGVLNQLDLSCKIDYKILARHIGAPSPGAAQVRWSRFRSKLRNSANTSPTKPIGIQKATKSPPKTTKRTERSLKKESSGNEEWTEDELESLPEIPVRRTPARKARAVVFKGEWSEEDEEMEEEELEQKKECDEVMKLMEGVEEGRSSADQSSSSGN